MRKFMFLLMVIVAVSCEHKQDCSYAEDCDKIIELNNSFCFLEISEINQIVQECNNFYDTILEDQAYYANRMMLLSKVRVMPWEITEINSLDSAKSILHEIDNEIEEFMDLRKEQLPKNNLQQYKNLIAEPRYDCINSVSIQKMMVLNKIRIFMYLLLQDTCNKEKNMHLFKPPAIGVFDDSLRIF